MAYFHAAISDENAMVCWWFSGASIIRCSYVKMAADVWALGISASPFNILPIKSLHALHARQPLGTLAYAALRCFSRFQFCRPRHVKPQSIKSSLLSFQCVWCLEGEAVFRQRVSQLRFIAVDKGRSALWYAVNAYALWNAYRWSGVAAW